VSRIEEDREVAQRVERLAMEQRKLEKAKKELREGPSAFAQKMEQTGAPQKQQKDSLAAKQRGEFVPSSPTETLGQAGKIAQAFSHRMATAQRDTSQQAARGRAEDHSIDAGAQKGRAQDSGALATEQEARFADTKVTKENLDARGEQHGSGGGNHATSQGDLRSDSEGGGQSGGGKDDREGRDGNGAASFRLNPALMAPTPLVQPTSSGASDRLRLLAQEIAQKVVERVRVGKNAAGEAEFQIDLKSSVLSGLSIRVSGSRGRIKAVFAGNDREVLKLLRERSAELKTALDGRGIVLEELRIEERA
jgi:hypothetical protein